MRSIHFSTGSALMMSGHALCHGAPVNGCWFFSAGARLAELILLVLFLLVGMIFFARKNGEGLQTDSLRMDDKVGKERSCRRPR